MEYAGFWRRGATIMIDTVLMIAFLFVLEKVFKLDFFYKNLIYQPFCLLYYAGMTAKHYQGTIGQIFLKVKIGDLSGNKLSPMQSTVRYILCGLPSIPLAIYISLPQTIYFASKLETIAAGIESKAKTLSQNQISAEIVDLIKTPEVAMHIQYFLTFTAIMLIGSIIWTLPIAFTKQKTGIHDLIAQQRAFKR